MIDILEKIDNLIEEGKQLKFFNKQTNTTVYFEKGSDGKWHEWKYEGEEPYGWGSKTYMGYLSANDLASWLSKDYGGSWKKI